MSFTGDNLWAALAVIAVMLLVLWWVDKPKKKEKKQEDKSKPPLTRKDLENQLRNFVWDRYLDRELKFRFRGYKCHIWMEDEDEFYQFDIFEDRTDYHGILSIRFNSLDFFHSSIVYFPRKSRYEMDFILNGKGSKKWQTEPSNLEDEFIDYMLKKILK